MDDAVISTRRHRALQAELLCVLTDAFSPSGVIALFCRQYDIIKDNEPNNSKEKAKSASENSTPEHQGGGLLRSKVSAGGYSRQELPAAPQAAPHHLPPPAGMQEGNAKCPFTSMHANTAASLVV